MLGPYVVGVESAPAGVRGVYVVLDPNEVCAYVGKAFSLNDSRRVNERIRTHVRDLGKRDAFSHFYLLPLRKDTSPRQVEVVEGWVARHMRPYMGSTHPNPLASSR